MGTWRAISGEVAPHEDILDIIHDLPKGMDEIASGRRFPYRRIESSSSEEASVVPGGLILLSSPDPRVRRMIANWPVVDWKILDRSEKVETAKENSIIRGTTEMKSRRRGFWCFTRKLNPHVPYENSSRFAGSIGGGDSPPVVPLLGRATSPGG